MAPRCSAEPRARARCIGRGLVHAAGGRYKKKPRRLFGDGASMTSELRAPAYFCAARPAGAGGAAAGAARAFFLAARSSSQIVIGAAMNQVEYVPEMMPTSIAAAKSKIVPTP